MKPTNHLLVMGCILLLLNSARSFAANVRGQLVCKQGQAAIGIAVTVYSQQFGRSTAFFTGGDGMYYFNNIPAGPYTLKIWTSRKGNAPTNTYAIFVNEPLTDLPRVYLPVCFAQ
jgi:Carboxypeptidase regulatory-like domain